LSNLVCCCHGGKNLYYDRLLLYSNNKSKTTWNIVKTVTNNKVLTITTMNIKNKLSHNPLAIANAFNTYFSSIAENILNKNFSGKNTINNNDSISYLCQNFRRSFLSMPYLIHGVLPPRYNSHELSTMALSVYHLIVKTMHNAVYPMHTLVGHHIHCSRSITHLQPSCITLNIVIESTLYLYH